MARGQAIARAGVMDRLTAMRDHPNWRTPAQRAAGNMLIDAHVAAGAGRRGDVTAIMDELRADPDLRQAAADIAFVTAVYGAVSPAFARTQTAAARDRLYAELKGLGFDDPAATAAAVRASQRHDDDTEHANGFLRVLDETAPGPTPPAAAATADRPDGSPRLRDQATRLRGCADWLIADAAAWVDREKAVGVPLFRLDWTAPATVAVAGDAVRAGTLRERLAALRPAVTGDAPNAALMAREALVDALLAASADPSDPAAMLEPLAAARADPLIAENMEYARDDVRDHLLGQWRLFLAGEYRRHAKAHFQAVGVSPERANICALCKYLRGEDGLATLSLFEPAFPECVLGWNPATDWPRLVAHRTSSFG